MEERDLEIVKKEGINQSDYNSGIQGTIADLPSFFSLEDFMKSMKDTPKGFLGISGVGRSFRVRKFLKEEFKPELAPPRAYFHTFTDEAGVEWVHMSF